MSAVDVKSITKHQKIILLVVAVGGHALKHIYHAAFFVVLPEIKSSLSLSNIQIGTFATIQNVAGALANIPAGFAADRFNRKRGEILGLSFALTGVFALGLGLASSYALAILAAGLMTVSMSFWHPAAIATLSSQFSDRKGLAISLHGSGASIGEALGPIISGLLIGVYAWRLVCQGSVAPALLIGGMIWILLRSIPQGTAAPGTMTQYFRSIQHLIQNRRLFLILVFTGGYAGGQSIILTFLPIYLREDLGVSSIELGLYLSLAQVAGIFAQPVLGFLSDRRGRKIVIAPGLAILGAFFILLYLIPPGNFFILTLLLMGSLLFPLMAILIAAAMDLIDTKSQATVVALIFASAIAITGISPALAGILADAWGIKITFLWAAGLVLCTALGAASTNWQTDAAQ